MAEEQQPPQTMKAAVAEVAKSKTAIISVILTLLTSAIGVGWNGLERFAAWAGQHADKVIETHVESVKNTDTAVKKLTETTGEIADTQKQQAKAIDGQGKAIEGIHETLKGVQRTQESIDATLKRLPAKQE